MGMDLVYSIEGHIHIAYHYGMYYLINIENDVIITEGKSKEELIEWYDSLTEEQRKEVQ